MKEETKTPVVEKCKGCIYVLENHLCKVYYHPETKWTGLNCPMCSTTVREVAEEKKALDPIKASKRRMGK
jgi:hypothetical protein